MSLHTYGGVTMEVRDGSYHHLDCNVVEEVQREYFPDLLDVSSLNTVLDIGGNIGAFSCYVLARNPGCQVVAVEPEMSNYMLMLNNIRRYSNQDTHMLLARCGYDMTLTKLAVDPINGGGHRCVKPGTEGNLVDAPAMITVEGLLSFTKHGRADLMKIDCEGGEVDILLHMPAETFLKIGAIVGEWHMPLVQYQETIQDRLSWIYRDIVNRPNPYNAERGVFLARK